MSRRLAALVLVLVGVAVALALLSSPRLDFVSPRVVSNQSAYPVMIYGEGFVPGMELELATDPPVSFPTELVDERHMTALIKPVSLPAGEVWADIKTRLTGAEGELTLRVVNDAAFPTPLGIAATAERIFVADPNGDRLWLLPRLGGTPGSVPAGDGPRDLALYTDGAGKQWVVVAQQFDENLLLLDANAPEVGARRIAVGVGAQSITIAGATAYVTNHVRDTVQVVDLASGAVRNEVRVGANPRAVTVISPGKRVAVGNLDSDDVSIVDIAAGTELRTRPGRTTPILGGHTEQYQPFIMGGKRPRALVYSAQHQVVLVADTGPNIGPNPDRMEVSANGGIGVVDPQTGGWLRHVSMLRGVPQALAIDDTAGLLYVADISTGRLVVFDVAKLAGSDESARGALVVALEFPIPQGAPLIRRPQDFGVKGRSSASVHSGPTDLVLVDGGTRLLVLERFLGRVTELDVSAAAAGTVKIRRHHRGLGMGKLLERRLGEIIYFTDLSNMRMTCDVCHPEGHSGGVLFVKKEPIHTHRSPTMRGISETAPYFTPAMYPHLDEVGRTVLSRNRFENPKSTTAEINALTTYQAAVTLLPNPHFGEGARLPKTLSLPDGTSGSPRQGLKVFEARGCTECHPPPHFTTDTDELTRGRRYDVGTRVLMPVREEMQDSERYDLPAISLSGTWDDFPLLHSGGGGFSVAEDGIIVPREFPLRYVLEMEGREKHGRLGEVSGAEVNDLIAYIMTL